MIFFVVQFGTNYSSMSFTYIKADGLPDSFKYISAFDDRFWFHMFSICGARVPLFLLIKTCYWKLIMTLGTLESFFRIIWWVIEHYSRQSYDRVASGQGKVREKIIFSRSGKSQGISPKVREFCNFWKSHGKVREFCRAVPVAYDTWTVMSLKKQI